MRKVILIFLLMFSMPVLKIAAQSEEDTRAFVKFIQEYKMAYTNYTEARNSEDATVKKQTPQLLKKLVVFYSTPVISKTEEWGNLKVDTLDIEKQFLANNYFTTPSVIDNISNGETYSEDFGENGNINYTLNYSNEEQYFYYDVVKNGPVSWEKGFKVKKIDGQLKLFEIFDRTF